MMEGKQIQKLDQLKNLKMSETISWTEQNGL